MRSSRFQSGEQENRAVQRLSLNYVLGRDKDVGNGDTRNPDRRRGVNTSCRCTDGPSGIGEVAGGGKLGGVRSVRGGHITIWVIYLLQDGGGTR